MVEQDGECEPVDFGVVDVNGINLARRFNSGKGLVVGVWQP